MNRRYDATVASDFAFSLATTLFVALSLCGAVFLTETVAAQGTDPVPQAAEASFSDVFDEGHPSSPAALPGGSKDFERAGCKEEESVTWDAGQETRIYSVQCPSASKDIEEESGTARQAFPAHGVRLDVSKAVDEAVKRRTERLLKSWSSGSDYRTRYRYDADGNRTEALREKLQDGQWTNVRRHSYIYDAKGREIEWRSESWQNGQWRIGQRETYSYDGSTRTKEHLEWKIDGEWVTVRLAYFTPDKRPLEYLFKHYDETGTVTHGDRGTYRYDADGNRTEHRNERWDGSQWVGHARRTYSYNADGNLDEWLYEEWKSGQWVDVHREIYTYDEHGNPTELFSERWENDQWENHSRETYTYDNDGNHTETLREHWDDDQWWRFRRTTYAYDADGNPIEEKRFDWYGGDWFNFWRETNGYDAEGNRTEYHTELKVNGVWETMSLLRANANGKPVEYISIDYSYTDDLSTKVSPHIFDRGIKILHDYDGSGNRIEQTRKNRQEGQWVNDEHITFSYDRDGDRTEELYERWEGGQWVKANHYRNRYGVLLPPPSRVEVEAHGSALELSWSESPHDSLAGYNLYRAREAFEDTSEAKRVNETLLAESSFVDEGLTADERYVYRLAAVSRSGLQSGLSALAQGTTVRAAVHRRFEAANRPSDYRLVALPGQAEVALSETLSDEAAWSAYWDDGSDENYLVEHDGSEVFRFTAGRGFWLVSTEDWKVEKTLAAPLIDDTVATIELHEGWNIISNPLGDDVAWSAVEAASGAELQPIWRFDGSFQQAGAFASAKDGEAFYFLNDQGLERLRVPYPASEDEGSSAKGAPRLASGAKDAPPTLRLTAYSGEEPLASVEAGLAPGNGQAPRPVVAPPARFAKASLWIEAEEASGDREASERARRLAAAYRLAQAGGQAFDLRLIGTEEASLRLQASGLSRFAGDEVMLLDLESGRRYDLTREESVMLGVSDEGRSLRLLVGSEAFVGRQAERLRPERLALEPTYPNPFRAQTTVTYALPEPGEVRLSVFDLLGREVAVLVSGQQPAGRHRIRWDGRSRNGAPLASGVYFTRLKAGGERFTQKVVLVR